MVKKVSGLELLLFFLFLPFTWMVNGWVLSILWEWFIVPQFDVKSLTVVNAIGISIVVGMFTAHVAQKKRAADGEASLMGALGASVATQLFVLLIGAVVHAFQ